MSPKKLSLMKQHGLKSDKVKHEESQVVTLVVKRESFQRFKEACIVNRVTPDYALRMLIAEYIGDSIADIN